MTLSELKAKAMLPHDIANHALYGGLIGAVTAVLWAHYEIQTLALLPWQAGLAAAALVGIGVDLLDKAVGGKFTPADVAATAAGALIPAIPQII